MVQTYRFSSFNCCAVTAAAAAKRLNSYETTGTLDWSFLKLVRILILTPLLPLPISMGTRDCTEYVSYSIQRLSI